MNLFNKKSEVSTDEAKIQELLTRGVENIYPSREFLERELRSGRRLKLYLGVDPTGPTLHVGHAIPLKKLKEFQDLGHEIVLLIGDFTAMIGDPDKLSTRKQLTRKEVLNNCKLYKKQASVFLKFTGKNAAHLEYNSTWLAKMTFEDVIGLASKMTVDQMLKRDMFKKRMEEQRPVYIHEFMYPLMQGYDSVAMNVDGEIGGNDQTFNMLAGRDLMKEIQNKEKFVITSKLLVDPSGKKMGKTEGNMLTLIDTADDMFGKVMSWTDAMIIDGFELCTNVPSTEIAQIKKDLEGGVNPRDIKVRLAKEVISIYHGADKAALAESNFVNTFKKGGVPEDAPEVSVAAGVKLVDVLLAEKVIASKGELRRLVEEGAVSVVDREEKITSVDVIVTDNGDYKVGKRRFLKIRIKK